MLALIERSSLRALVTGNEAVIEAAAQQLPASEYNKLVRHMRRFQ
jgi:hypothetical protein